MRRPPGVHRPGRRFTSPVPQAVALVIALCLQTAAQTVQTPYDKVYSIADLGSVPGVPTRYGGLTFLDSDPNTILIGGEANVSTGALYSIAVVRDVNHRITGFSGTAAVFADAAYNDGGVAYGPGNVLFLARWPANEVGETKPGSTMTDKIVSLDAFTVTSSPGGLNFVASGFPGAGALKIATWPAGNWYTLQLAADAMGTFDVTAATLGTTTTGGPEGFIYVPPGSPLFADFTSVVVSEYSAGEIATYQLNSNGDPMPETRVSFITGLIGAEGAVTDPITGDFLFSTFGGSNHVIAVHGFAAPATPTFTPSVTATPTETPSPTDTATATPTPTATDTPSASVTATPTHTRTASPTATPTTRLGYPPTRTPTNTATPTETQSATLSPTGATATPTESPTETVTLTPGLDAPTATMSETTAETVTPTATATPTLTGVASETPTATGTSPATATPTETATGTPTETSLPSSTPTPTASVTPSASASASASPVDSATATPTPTETASATSSATVVPSASASPPPTATETPTETSTATGSATPTPSVTPMSTATLRPCVGDCNNDRTVTVDELVKVADIALGETPVGACQPGDCDGNGVITVDEVVAAVADAISGCQ